MKRLLAVLLVLSMTFPCLAFAGQGRVMTSFYPVYIFALNVFDGIEDITVECMTAPQTGCLHDYQLIMSDMLKLAGSQMFIVCGAGMELYLPDVQTQFPSLEIVDCSENLELLDACTEHRHDDHGHEHDHAVNPHTWLDIDNAIRIVDTIAAEGSARFPVHAEHILSNASAYKTRLNTLKEELALQLEAANGIQVITFHEGFAYFAKAFGVEILKSIGHDEEEGLRPKEILQLIDDVAKAGLPPLFAEMDGGISAAETVAAETGARLYAFDPITTGEYSLTAYENGMRKNLSALMDALADLNR